MSGEECGVGEGERRKAGRQRQNREQGQRRERASTGPAAVPPHILGRDLRAVRDGARAESRLGKSGGSELGGVARCGGGVGCALRRATAGRQARGHAARGACRESAEGTPR